METSVRAKQQQRASYIVMTILRVAAIVLLLLYYLSHPPVFTEPGFFREGSYFIISKDLLEIIGLAVLMFFPTGQFLGLDGLLSPMAGKPMHRMDHGQPEAEETRAHALNNVQGSNRPWRA